MALTSITPSGIYNIVFSPFLPSAQGYETRPLGAGIFDRQFRGFFRHTVCPENKPETVLRRQKRHMH
jgi:hypothetical protein